MAVFDTTAGGSFTVPAGGATVEDDGVFLTIDTSKTRGFVVRSKDGSPLLLATGNASNVWLTGDAKALRKRIEETLPEFKWSDKRKALWTEIA